MKETWQKRERFLVFGEPDIGEPEIREVIETLRSCWIGTGPRVARFESEFGRYKGVEHVAAVSSCTAALHLSMLAAELEPGAEVITTPLTFCATINAIIHAGFTPVLADVDPNTMNIDPDRVAEKITPRTRALLPVHFAGRPCAMDVLAETAARHDLRIIEDCAHAIETEYRGRKAGTFGDFGCFSFYATKNVTTGEGGMVLARREQDMARIKRLALHGLSADAWKRFSDSGYKHYTVVECGQKCNMTDLQAALGIHQLRRVDENWRRRGEIWARYTAALAGTPLGLPAPVPAGTRHAYHLYTVLVDEQATGISRDAFIDAMTAQGIGVGVHYLSIPEHPYYQTRYGWAAAAFPHAARIGRQTVSLPLSAKLQERDVEDVIAATRRVLSRKSLG